MTASAPTTAAVGRDLDRQRRIGVPSAVSADLLKPPSKGLDALLLSLIALVAAFIVWAAVSPLEEVTRGQGRIVPASKIQLVQNLEGGIVREVLVREGAIVREGDVILRIDATQAGSSLGEASERVLGLEALMARLQAETEGRALSFGAELERKRPDLVSDQRDHFAARRKELDAALASLDLQERQKAQEILELESRVKTLTRSLEIAQSELAMLAPLAKSGAASRSEMLAIESKINDTEGALAAATLALPRVRAAREETLSRKAERVSAYQGEALQRLSTARVEHRALTEQTRGQADKLARTTVRAPASGIVKTVHVSTPGQVVQPGMSLIEIVPANDTLLVEARVRPQDIGFLQPGQPALVRLTAYDFSIYGGLKGKVEHIGADSITNDRGETYYLINVRTERATLAHKGSELAILPGMVADVDVLTGRKTVLQYLLKPITRMRQNAMTER